MILWSRKGNSILNNVSLISLIGVAAHYVIMIEQWHNVLRYLPLVGAHRARHLKALHIRSAWHRSTAHLDGVDDSLVVIARATLSPLGGFIQAGVLSTHTTSMPLGHQIALVLKVVAYLTTILATRHHQMITGACHVAHSAHHVLIVKGGTVNIHVIKWSVGCYILGDVLQFNSVEHCGPCLGSGDSFHELWRFVDAEVVGSVTSDSVVSAGHETFIETTCSCGAHSSTPAYVGYTGICRAGDQYYSESNE